MSPKLTELSNKSRGIGDFNANGFSEVLWRNDIIRAWGWFDVHNHPAWYDLVGGSLTAYNVLDVGDFNVDFYWIAGSPLGSAAMTSFIESVGKAGREIVNFGREADNVPSCSTRFVEGGD
jgi:hypothetical protein